MLMHSNPRLSDWATVYCTLRTAPQVGEVRRIADKSYTLEAWWYDNIRDRLPIPQPKCYWTGCESAADTSTDFGQYVTSPNKFRTNRTLPSLPTTTATPSFLYIRPSP